MSMADEQRLETNEPLLVDTRAAARLLGLSKSALEHDRATREIGVPFVRLGGSVRYDPRALREWIKTRTVNTAQQPQPCDQPHGATPRRRGRPRKPV